MRSSSSVSSFEMVAKRIGESMPHMRNDRRVCANCSVDKAETPKCESSFFANRRAIRSKTRCTSGQCAVARDQASLASSEGVKASSFLMEAQMSRWKKSLSWIPIIENAQASLDKSVASMCEIVCGKLSSTSLNTPRDLDDRPSFENFTSEKAQQRSACSFGESSFILCALVASSAMPSNSSGLSKSIAAHAIITCVSCSRVNLPNCGFAAAVTVVKSAPDLNFDFEKDQRRSAISLGSSRFTWSGFCRFWAMHRNTAGARTDAVAKAHAVCDMSLAGTARPSLVEA
mmetsp:Transcript_26482/g.89092  ORF Transcript_26482/g.89092 Transcript_26482/m.89092 type:complete len:287 (+) Transcript_26482:1636-2496(+)